MAMGIEDKLAIHELLGRAALGYDERDEDMLASCFAQNANMSMRIGGGDVVGPFQGRDAIMKLMTDSMASQSDVRRHVISNIVFTNEASGASADAAQVLSNLTLLATENDNIQLLSAGLYRDDVVRLDGVWCIANRYLDLDKPY